jgi:hypothetical protein
MKVTSKFVRIGLFAAALLFASFTAASAQDSEFSFKVANKTDVTIKKLMVSVDGKKWGFFDIGAGIASGKTAELVWSKTTDSEPCKQWVKAVYADKSESKPVKFDFCEEDLELEFTD